MLTTCKPLCADGLPPGEGGRRSANTNWAVCGSEISRSVRDQCFSVFLNIQHLSGKLNSRIKSLARSRKLMLLPSLYNPSHGDPFYDVCPLLPLLFHQHPPSSPHPLSPPPKHPPTSPESLSIHFTVPHARVPAATMNTLGGGVAQQGEKYLTAAASAAALTARIGPEGPLSVLFSLVPHTPWHERTAARRTKRRRGGHGFGAPSRG